MALTYKMFQDAFDKTIKGMPEIGPLEIIYTSNAIVRMPDVPKVIKRSLKERFLSWPWKPWISTKTIMVEEWSPGAFQHGNKLFVHPSLKNNLEAMLKGML